MLINKIYIKNIFFYILLSISLITLSVYTFSLYVSENSLIYLTGFGLSAILFVAAIYNPKISFLIFVFIIPFEGIIKFIFTSTDFHFNYFLLLGFFLGSLINVFRKKKLVDFSDRFYRPAIVLLILLTISFLSVLLRLKLIPLSIYGMREYFSVNVLDWSSFIAIKYSITPLLYFLSGLLLFLTVANFKISKKFIRYFFYIIAASFIIFFFIGWYQITVDNSFANTPYWIRANRFNATFIDPHSLGLYLSMLFPIFLGFGYYLYGYKKIIGIFSYFLSALTLLLLPFTGSRSSFLGFMFVSIFYIIYFILILINKVYRNIKITRVSLQILLKTVSFIIIILIIFSLVFSSLFYLVKTNSLDDSPELLSRLQHGIYQIDEKGFISIVSGRNYLWSQAINMFKDNPLTGVGMGQYRVELPMYLSAEYGNKNLIMDGPLNLYLQILSEMGILPFLVWLWFIVEIFVLSITFYKKIKGFKRTRFLYLNIILSFSAMLVVNSFGGNTGDFSSLYLSFIIIGFLVNFRETYLEDHREVSTN